MEEEQKVEEQTEAPTEEAPSAEQLVEESKDPATEEETPAEEPATEEETPVEEAHHSGFGEKVHHVVEKVEEALHLKKKEESSEETPKEE